MTRPQATVITAQLVGRWVAELAALIHRADYAPGDRSDPLPSGAFGTWADADRERMAQIGNDLLVRLDDVGALNTSRVQQLARVTRGHDGRPVGSPPAAGAPRGSGPVCACGSPGTLGTVHRLDGPCYVPTEDPPGVDGGRVGHGRAVDWTPSGEPL